MSWKLAAALVLLPCMAVAAWMLLATFNQPTRVFMLTHSANRRETNTKHKVLALAWFIGLCVPIYGAANEILFWLPPDGAGTFALLAAVMGSLAAMSEQARIATKKHWASTHS